MPTEYSNFTTPDRQPTEREVAAEGGGGYWDPVTRKWIRPEDASQAQKDAYLNPEGSNGDRRAYNAGQEADRYEGLAGPAHATAPQIDQARSNQARGLNMGGLDLLRQRAGGGVPTHAQQLSVDQTRGAVAGVQSNAASIRGGAMARAAAARGATTLGTRLTAQGAQDQQALRAREMADATGQYVKATGDQRNQDLGVATDQAKLQAGHNAANDQRDAYYENLRFGTKRAAVDVSLQRSNQAATAAQNERQANLAEQAATQRNIADVGRIGSSTIAGGASAYATAQQGQERPKPDPYATSDERAKTGIRDLSTSGMEAKRGISPLRDDVRLGSKEKAYDGKYLPPALRKPERLDVVSGADWKAEKEKPADLDAAMAKSVEGATPYERERGGSLFGAKMGEGAERGYAREREGQPGYMFGGAPRAHYDRLADESREEAYADRAPGTADLDNVHGTTPDKFSREVMRSDMRTKEEEMSPKERLRSRVEEPPKWLRDEMETRDLGEIDDPPKDLGDVDAPDFAGRYEGEIKDTSTREPVSQERHISPADQKKIDAMLASQEAQNTMLGESSVARASRRDSMEEDYADRLEREAGDSRTAFTSDSRAKQEAYRLGVEAGRGGPAGMTGPRGHGGTSGGSTSGGESFAKPEKPKAEPPGPVQAAVLGAKKKIEGGLDETAARASDMAKAATGNANRSTSDERAKTKAHDSPMASANRSMEPSSYEYKPEFTPPEQKPGEVNVGPMANKMKANPIARTAIVEDEKPPHMLAIDKTKGLKLVMGGLADLQRQVDQMKRRA